MKYCFIPLTLLAMLSSFCKAQTTTTVVAKDTTTNLQEVVVSATRKSSNTLSLPYSISVLERKNLDNYQFRTTPEALMGTAGVFVQKTNHGGGSPFVRGLTGNQTLLLIDGIRFNNATFRYGPNQYLNTIDQFTVDKIEVARGTGSVQYGSDALGGVVQILTKTPQFNSEKKWLASVTGKAISQDIEYTGRADVQYQSKKVALIAGYTQRKFGDLVGGDTTGKQTPSGYTEQAFDAKLKWQAATNAVVTLAHQYVQQNDVPLYHRVKLENFAYYFFAPQKRQMSYAKLDVTTNHALVSAINVTASLQNSLENRSYLKNGNANRFIEEDKVHTFGFTADITSNIFKNWTANSGIEYYHDKVQSIKQQITVTTSATLNQRGLYPNNATSGNFSLYSLHHINLHKFKVEAGLRYNSFAITIPDTATTTALKLGDVTVRPASLVGNLAVLYSINSKQSVYASVSTGYRTPNIDDMGTLGLVDFRWEIPAYSLQPEKTYNTEIGYKYQGKSVNASVALYYMHLANLITRVQVAGQQVGGYNVYTKENSQESYIKGFETNITYRINSIFTMRGNVSYAFGQNLSRNEPMRRIPPFNGNLQFNYQKNKWLASAEYQFASTQNRLAQGDKDDNRIPKGGTPSWQVLNLNGAYKTNSYAVRLGLQNMFNQDYRTHGSGINGMGRSLVCGLQFFF
jgi:outer membrane receptor protein involved in Fe transport